MTMHDLMRISAAATGTSVAAAERTVGATVPPGRSPVPEPAPLRRLAAKPVEIPSPDVRAMRVRTAAIAPEPETGDGNGKNKRAWNFPGKINK